MFKVYFCNGDQKVVSRHLKFEKALKKAEKIKEDNPKIGYPKIVDSQGDKYFLDGTGSGFRKGKQSNEGMKHDKFGVYKQS